MPDEGEKRENVPLEWMNELKKEEYNVQDLQGTEKEKKNEKTSLVLQEPELHASIADRDLSVRQEKRGGILIPGHGCAQASLAIGSRTAVEGERN